MKKLVYFLYASLALLTVSCRQTVNEAKNFPNVATYSPGVAVSGDTVTILGSTLTSASVLVGNKEVQLVDSSDSFLKFIVDDLISPAKEDGFYDLTVSFEEFEDRTFAMPIVLNHIVSDGDILGWLEDVDDVVVGEVLPTGPAQLLITDFDGGGVRLADATSLFDATQFENQVQPTGVSDITSSANLAIPNPLGNNFYRLTVSDLTQLGGSGHAGEMASRAEVLNDRVTEFPVSFVDYPNGPLKAGETDNDLKDIYINFLFYKNDAIKTIVYPYIFNDFLDGGNQYRSNFDFNTVNNVKVSSEIAVDEWVWQSIRVRDYKENFGFAGTSEDGTRIYSRLTPEAWLTINKVKFGVAHEDKLDNQEPDAEGEVQFYLDHIIITQGAPFYGHKR